jgi:hypothetical protein
VSLCEPLWGLTERDLLSYPKGDIKEDLGLIIYMVDQGLSEARTVPEDKAVQARLEQARKNDHEEIIDNWASVVKLNMLEASEMCDIIYNVLKNEKLVNLINQHVNTDKYYRKWFNDMVDRIVKLHRRLTALRDGKDEDDVLATIREAMQLSLEIKDGIKEILLYMINEAFNLL